MREIQISLFWKPLQCSRRDAMRPCFYSMVCTPSLGMNNLIMFCSIAGDHIVRGMCDSHWRKNGCWFPTSEVIWNDLNLSVGFGLTSCWLWIKTSLEAIRDEFSSGHCWLSCKAVPVIYVLFVLLINAGSDPSYLCLSQ